jgi:pyrroline-5-carboxylate reductase
MSDWPRSIGLVGCGAMGRAMLAGLLRGRDSDGDRCVLVDAVPEAAAVAATESGGRIGTVVDAAACDLVVLAVKPKDAPAVLAELRGGLGSSSVLVSVVAGLDIDRILSAAPGAAVARTMPNLAVRHGAGLIAIATRDVPDATRGDLLDALRPLGAVVELPEHLIGPATALVGSGPGFVALVAEGLEDGAVAIGFPREQARRMVQAVIAGSAALLADGSDPADLRQRVSSPAGTTIEGIGVLERGGVRGHVADAVRAAARRASEL